jgi:hypothetical protein
MIPYSVYLPVDYYMKIKVLAQQRKASEAVRDAIILMLDGGDAFKAGYRKALVDAAKSIESCKDIEHLSIRGTPLSALLAASIGALE